jgi:hypothetical protein
MIKVCIVDFFTNLIDPSEDGSMLVIFLFSVKFNVTRPTEL